MTREIIGGFTTFVTIAYIVVVNPAILASAGTGMPFSGVLTATVLLAMSMTLFMGLYAKLPYAVAPGMGVNAFFTYSLVLTRQIPWPTALGMVFWAGVCFVLLSTTPIRERIALAIPHSLRIGSAAGIGLLLALIGFHTLGIVTADPENLVRLGKINPSAAVALGGLVLTIALWRRKNPFAFLAGIFLITAVSLIKGWAHAPTHWFSPPDFKSVFFKLDVWGALKWSFLPTILSLLFTDLFDSVATYVGVSQATGLQTPQGEPLRLKEGLIVDAFSTLTAGLFGTSSGTTYLESMAGIEAGARTGLAAVVTALCFIPCFFIGPLVEMVPAHATAPVLILIGGMLFKTALDLKTEKPEEWIPAFLTLTLTPLTFSITQGLLWGFISYVVLFAVSGRRREISPLLWGIGALSVFLLAIEFGQSK